MKLSVFTVFYQKKKVFTAGTVLDPLNSVKVLLEWGKGTTRVVSVWDKFGVHVGLA